MKKLITLVAIAAAIVASPVNAVMVRTVLIQAQVEFLMTCYAGYDSEPFQTYAQLFEDGRYSPNPEGDQIPNTTDFRRMFERIDHDAYYIGKDVKKEGWDKKEGCRVTMVEYIKKVAHSINADDFIADNPQVFGSK